MSVHRIEISSSGIRACFRIQGRQDMRHQNPVAFHQFNETGLIANEVRVGLIEPAPSTR